MKLEQYDCHIEQHNFKPTDEDIQNIVAYCKKARQDDLSKGFFYFMANALKSISRAIGFNN